MRVDLSSTFAIAAACLLGLASMPSAASAQGGATLIAENFRCLGQPVPPAPGPGWQVQPVWEWRDLIHLDGTQGANDGPYAVALDRACNIYLTDSKHFQIVKLSREGTELARWTLPGDHAPTDSSSPHGVAVDQHGNVYATDTPHDRVYKFGPDGKVLAVWGVCDHATADNHFCDPKQPGRFIGPEGIGVDGSDNVYVSETAGGRMQKLSGDGKPLAAWDYQKLFGAQQNIAGSVSIDWSGFVYVSDAYNNQIIKIHPETGEVVKRFGGEQGDGPGQFHGPQGVGLDMSGNIYVSDAQNWRVEKLGPDGAFQTQWRLCLDGDPPCQFPDAGQDPGQFMYSRGIVADQQGTIYVADTANQRVQRLMIVDFVLIPPPDQEDDAASAGE
jgi:DNA-binding beta-propeller fold protein YncE